MSEPTGELMDDQMDAVTRITKRQEAGARYLRGEITYEEYAVLKARYATRYAEAMKAIGANNNHGTFTRP